MPPQRPSEASKTDFGKALLLCGSAGFTGAARLAAEGCARAGAGLIILGVPERIHPILAAACPPEIMCRPLPCDLDGRLSYDAMPSVLGLLERCDAALVGPGLGRSEQLDRLVGELRDRREVPLVVDADGINALACCALPTAIAPIAAWDSRPPLLLTPHEREFGRLGGDTADPDRAAAVARLSRRLGAVVVRKGHVTLTASPDGALYANTTGNPGMAKGGCGDLLAGFLTGLVAQKSARPGLWSTLDWTKLCACAVYWHGRAGDLCAGEYGEYGMAVSDMAKKLPHAMKEDSEVRRHV